MNVRLQSSPLRGDRDAIYRVREGTISWPFFRNRKRLGGTKPQVPGFRVAKRTLLLFNDAPPFPQGRWLCDATHPVIAQGDTWCTVRDLPHAAGRC